MIFIPIIFGILIIPILLNVTILYKSEDKIIYICFKLFNIIKVFKIKIFYKNGLFIKLNSKRKNQVVLGDVFLIKNKIKPFKDYNVLSFKSAITLNISQKYWPIFALFYQEINRILHLFFTNKKPYLTIENSLTFSDENKTKISTNITVFINVFTILVSLIKIGAQKIINEFGQEQNKQRNRNSIKEHQSIN